MKNKDLYKSHNREINEELAEFKLVMNNPSIWMWSASLPDFKLTIFNYAVESYFFDNYGIRVEIGMSLEEILSEDRVIFWRDCYEKAISEGEFRIDYETRASHRMMSVIVSPLIIDDHIVGVSVLGRDVTTEWEYKCALEESYKKLAQRLRQAINAISKIGELRDAYTAGHQKRVSELACAIAIELGMDGEKVNNIFLGAMIHDIGKIYIASDTLNKPGKISPLEYQILQTHAEYGFEVVKEIEFAEEIPLMVYQHHERLDGSGYPNQLVGDEIILESRILAVADVVEAMSSHRPYRPALGIDAALDEIRRFRGTKFDDQVVDACLKLFKEERFAFFNE